MDGAFRLSSYYDKIIRGTAREDTLVILQFFQGMVGQKFSFLNYFKEIPVSYDAILLNVEREMAEFAVHENQAKTITIDKNTIITAHPLSPFPEDMFGEVFYVNTTKKRVILCNFGYARVHSNNRRFVRVLLENRVGVQIQCEEGIIDGIVQDISLGGAAIDFSSTVDLKQGQEITLHFRLPDNYKSAERDVPLAAKVIKVEGEDGVSSCVMEFVSDKRTQQLMSYFINQRQVEIIRDLKDITL